MSTLKCKSHKKSITMFDRFNWIFKLKKYPKVKVIKRRSFTKPDSEFREFINTYSNLN